MGIYVFRPGVMSRVLAEDARDGKSSHDFGKDIIPKLVDTGKVFAFSFIDENRKEAKYWRDVGTIEAYYAANLDLVGVTPLLNLYDTGWPIRTVPVVGPPPKFVSLPSRGAGGDRAGLAVCQKSSRAGAELGARRTCGSTATRSGGLDPVRERERKRAKIQRAIMTDGRSPREMGGYDLVDDARRFLG